MKPSENGTDRAAFISSAVDTLSIEFAVLDTDGTILALNDAWREFAAENDIAFRPGSVGVNYLEEIASADTEYARHAVCGLAEVLDGDRTLFTLEYPCCTAPDRRWFLMRATSFVHGGRVCTAVAHVDITTQKRHERRMRALHDATRALMGAKSEQAVAEYVADAASEILQMSRIGVHLYDEYRDVLSPAAWTPGVEADVDEPPTLGRESLAWKVFSEGTPRECQDLTAEDELYNPDTPFRSELIVPLNDHGVVLVSSRETDAFDERERQLVEIMAENATAALDRVRRERELRGFKEAVEQAGHSIVATDTDGRIEYVNPAFEDVTGYTAAEAVGTNPRILNSGEHDRAFDERMWETILGGDVWQAELVNERKDGEQFVVDQTIAPILDEDGDVERFVAVNNDVTERKELETRLKDQRDDLEVLNQVVRHDIRNDLQLVLGFADVLDAHVDDDGGRYLEKIVQSAENAVALTETARTLAESMLQVGTEREAVSLRGTLASELEEARSAHDDAVITTDGSIPDRRVLADDMLSSVFRNVLQNAIQHNDEEIPEVRVSVTEMDDSVVVSVADNGPGIPDSRKADVFGKGENGLESDGSGLGLYLVYTLVDRNGGEVWIEDAELGGAAFKVELQTAEDACRG